jgi:hypothetical protein
MFVKKNPKQDINPVGRLMIALCCESEVFYEQHAKKYYCKQCGKLADKIEMREICKRTHLQVQRGVYSPIKHKE